MNSNDAMLQMKWKGKIFISSIDNLYANNIIKCIQKEPLNKIWFGYQGFAWIEALKYQIKLNSNLNKINAKELTNFRQTKLRNTEIAVDNLLDGICKAAQLV